MLPFLFWFDPRMTFVIVQHTRIDSQIRVRAGWERQGSQGLATASHRHVLLIPLPSKVVVADDVGS
jgi:hypothetical protein